MATTNDMLRRNRAYYNADVVCGKTGWTEQAGRCLVSYASRNGMNLICVTMNAIAPNQFLDTKQLLDYGFDQFSLMNISESDHSYDSSHLIDSPLHFMQETKGLVQLDPSSRLILPVTLSFDQLERRVTNDQNAPATITYYYQNYRLGSASIVPITHDDVTNLFRDQTKLPEQLSSLSITSVFVIPIWGIFLSLTTAALLLFGLLKGFQRSHPNDYRRYYQQTVQWIAAVRSTRLQKKKNQTKKISNQKKAK